MRKSSIFIHRTMSSFFVPCRRVLNAGIETGTKLEDPAKLYFVIARKLPAEYKAKYGVPKPNTPSRFGASLIVAFYFPLTLLFCIHRKGDAQEL